MISRTQLSAPGAQKLIVFLLSFDGPAQARNGCSRCPAVAAANPLPIISAPPFPACPRPQLLGFTDLQASSLMALFSLVRRPCSLCNLISNQLIINLGFNKFVILDNASGAPRNPALQLLALVVAAPTRAGSPGAQQIASCRASTPLSLFFFLQGCASG